METNRPDLTEVLTNYDAIVRRAHEERRRALSEVLARIARRLSSRVDEADLGGRHC
jgi:hypothetical protein